jgi:hypothetical protein
MGKYSSLMMDALSMLDSGGLNKLRHNRMRQLEELCQKDSCSFINEDGDKVFDDVNDHRYINELMKELTILTRQCVIRANR